MQICDKKKERNMSNLSGIVPCEQYDIFRPEGFQHKKNISSAIKLSHIFTVWELLWNDAVFSLQVMSIKDPKNFPAGIALKSFF